MLSGAAGALRARVSAMSYLPKWLLLASVIGVIAGLGAVVFYEALGLSTHLFLGLLAGYRVPTPAGEGNAAGSAHYARAWAIPLVVVLGALLSGWRSSSPSRPRPRDTGRMPRSTRFTTTPAASGCGPWP